MQPECISQRASSGRLNCSCSRSRDLTAINPVVPEMMKIAALAVSTAPGGNMSFAFSKSVPIAPAKGRGKRTPAWTNRRAKALVPCGFADAKTAKGILQYQNSRKRLSNCPRIPREEVRKYGSFQSGAKYGIYRYEQPPLAKGVDTLQEEVTQKTIALYVKVGKGAARLTEQALQKAIQKFLEQKSKPAHGKQTMRQLMKQNAGVSNIEITDSNIKAFESTAKKYNIDFSLKKVKGEQTRYLVFFKGRDADVMTAAFQEFSAKKLNREKKPSIRKALAAAKDKAKQLNAARDKVKKMDRGREI